jgi:3-oxoacid CoA-transferase subunit A
MKRIYVRDMQTALTGILRDDLTIMAGGFGLAGIPENAIRVICESGIKNLTIISNDFGVKDFGLGLLLQKKQVKKFIGSYIGENEILQKEILLGNVELELVPQGTLAEKIRCGGAGIPAFFTPTGFGTVAAEGKETREINGRNYVLEYSLTADLSIIKAQKSDRHGNLQYSKTARNFNPIMATAGKVTVAEVAELVNSSEISTDATHTPGIYVDIIVPSSFENRIEHLVIKGAEHKTTY